MPYRRAALRSSLFVVVVLALFAGCAQDVSRAKALAERTLGEVVHFDLIELHGPIHADIMVGRGPSVSLEGPQELLDALQVTMGNDKLVLRLEHDDDDDDFVSARIETPSLRVLDLFGAGRVNVKDPVGESLRVSTAGASQVTVEGISLKNLHFTVAGASEALLSGRASEAHFALSGAGMIRAQDLITDVAHIDLSGAGSVRLHATQRVAGTVSGIGKVTVAGNPEERAITASGIGEVQFE